MPISAVMLLVAVLSLTGCATKPPTDTERAVSVALAEPGGTQLGRLYEADIAANPGKSGVMRISSGEKGFRTRVGLADKAEKSLDLQYYLWEVDTSGILLAERILRAADRGVRVRILLDHITTLDTDFRFAQMDFHPIENQLRRTRGDEVA